MSHGTGSGTQTDAFAKVNDWHFLLSQLQGNDPTFHRRLSWEKQIWQCDNKKFNPIFRWFLHSKDFLFFFAQSYVNTTVQWMWVLDISLCGFVVLWFVRLLTALYTRDGILLKTCKWRHAVFSLGDMHQVTETLEGECKYASLRERQSKAAMT